jgi:hypothetical protein
MDDSADPLEGAVQRQVRRRIGRRTAVSADDVAVEVDDDQVVAVERVIGDPTRLDRDEPAGAVDAADVSPRQRYQAVRRKRQVRREDLVAESI